MLAIDKKQFRINAIKISIYSLLLLSFTVAGFFSEKNYLLDIVSHFKAQYLIAGFILLLLNFLSKEQKKLFYTNIVILALSILINFIEIAPYTNVAPKNIHNDTGVKFLLSNVLTSNTDHTKLLDMISKKKPDVIILQETNYEWLNSLEDLTKTYKYYKVSTDTGSFGMVVFSKLPFIEQKEDFWGSFGISTLFLRIQIDNKPVDIVAVHTTPPKNQKYTNNRNQMLKNIISWYKKNKLASIVVGDLNTTMYSSNYKNLIKQTDLQNPRTKFGLNPSWPTTWPEFARIPLDQVLHSKVIQINSFELQNDIGSDHLPIIFTVDVN